MTNREFYAAIANGTMNDEIKTFAENAIIKMDERNAKRSSAPSKTAIENEPIKENILKYLAEYGKSCVASVIGESVGISTQKASALCRQLVNEEKLSETEVKVPKQGKRKAYIIVG